MSFYVDLLITVNPLTPLTYDHSMESLHSLEYDAQVHVIRWSMIYYDL